jgi:hypothetical protein
MTTARRRLGTGPSTASTAMTLGAGTRRLPAERADPVMLLEGQECDQEDEPGPRRRLGMGPRAAAYWNNEP